MGQPTSTQRDTSASASASASASSSSSSSALTPNGPYQVFNDNRGPDVQKSFAIKSRGLQVLLDQQELEPGHIIHSQIKASSASASASASSSSSSASSASVSATASASSSSSSASTPNVPYQVFINLRGPEVKKSFANFLHHELKSRGLQVFLDLSELEPGHPIFSQLEAIQSASVQIAIFSKTYAESKWCLDELVHMLETTRRDTISQRATILPVFYGVEPSELRWTDTGAYANAMLKHKQLYNLETVEKWKKALSDVAGISGFELEACNGNQVELLHKVVQRVLEEFPKPPCSKTTVFRKRFPYQVFISHRGPDVKKSFANFLHRELKSKGLQVFLDLSELEPGHPIPSQLEAAIQSASVQIVIFSKTYAESKWCLDELVDMLETTRRDTISQRATILPVFYEVKPYELRRTDREDTGAYANAMLKHEQRYNLETIEKWKKALADVADIFGFMLETFSGNQVELLHKVVQRVLEEVPKPPCSKTNVFPKRFPYQVFISHTGPDVKKSFANFLHRELKSKGLQVFLDLSELEPGHPIPSQLEAAIQSASVQIVIFSKTYAESKWCLDELVHMLETTRSDTRSQRAILLPVFYEVKPSDLTRRDGAYANAMQKHKQRYNLETIQKWKNALSDAADISGFELEACNGNEMELMHKLVQIVISKCK